MATKKRKFHGRVYKGRKPKPPEDRLSHSINIRVKPGEFEQLARIGEPLGLGPYDAARTIVRWYLDRQAKAGMTP